MQYIHTMKEGERGLREQRNNQQEKCYDIYIPEGFVLCPPFFEAPLLG